MEKTKERYYKGLFLFGAFYDWILGILFLFLYKPVYLILGIDLPSDPIYISLPAAFIFASGFAYYLVYKDLENSEKLVVLATIYKFAYTAVGFFYFFVLQTIPHQIFLIFGFIDVLFASLSIEFIFYLRNRF